jgi:hypothetical protein
MRLQNLSDMKEIVASFKNGNVEETLLKTSTFIENQHMNTIANWTARLYHNDRNKEETLIRKVWGFGIEAASRNERSMPAVEEENTKSDDSEALRDMMLAEHIAPKTWRGLWCLAVAFWIVGRSNGEKDLEQTLEWIQKARNLATHALELYTAATAEKRDIQDTHMGQDITSVESEPLSSVAAFRILDGEFDFSSPTTMIDSFLTEMKKVEEIVEQFSESQEENESEDSAQHLDLLQQLDQAVQFVWVNYMYIIQADEPESDGSRSPGEGTSVNVTNPGGHTTDSSNHEDLDLGNCIAYDM